MELLPEMYITFSQWAIGWFNVGRYHYHYRYRYRYLPTYLTLPPLVGCD